MNKKLTLSLATAFLATAAGGSIFAQDRSSFYPPGSKWRQDQTRPESESQAKTFTGKITKSNGKYMLEDTTGTSYQLDDQKNAQKYSGKSVLVTGTLDASSNTIRVQKIEAAA
jgi:hypothetical protein